MAQYYLISQLPSLDGLSENLPLPITEERFSELCQDALSEKELSQFDKISLSPSLESEKSSSALIEAWNNAERNLRLSLAKVRAEKLGKSYQLKENVPSEFSKIALEATDLENPMEAENFLLGYRLRLIESMRPLDNFSIDYVYYYSIKLKLISRVRQFDQKIGQSAYKNIYDSILNGERLEAKDDSK